MQLKFEILSKSNDQLLNNLKEGIFVFSENKEKVKFLNHASSKIFGENISCSQDKSRTTMINRKKQQYALVEARLLHRNINRDYVTFVSDINSVDSYASLDEIITEQLLSEEGAENPRSKLVYKVLSPL